MLKSTPASFFPPTLPPPPPPTSKSYDKIVIRIQVPSNVKLNNLNRFIKKTIRGLLTVLLL